MSKSPMEDRKKSLFTSILEEYVETAKPVGSKLLAKKAGISVSPATIRNELASLEKGGYLTHPHTSAGRIPTEKGYRFYIKELLENKPLAKSILKQLENSFKKANNQESKTKDLAKEIAEISNQGVFVGFSKDSFYYTGLSNIFRQPEFENIELVLGLSEVVDKLDESLSQIFDQVDQGLQVLIGQENPFGNNCATILTRNNKDQVFGLFGPMRMSYQINKPLIQYTEQLLTKI